MIASMVAIGHPSGYKLLMMDVRQAGQAHPNSLFKRGVNADGAAGAPSLCRAVVVSGAAPGTTCGNHRANYPRHLGASSGTVSAAQMHEWARRPGEILTLFRLTSEGSLVRTQLRTRQNILAVIVRPGRRGEVDLRARCWCCHQSVSRRPPPAPGVRLSRTGRSTCLARWSAAGGGCWFRGPRGRDVAAAVAVALTATLDAPVKTTPLWANLQPCRRSDGGVLSSRAGVCPRTWRVSSASAGPR